MKGIGTDIDQSYLNFAKERIQNTIDEQNAGLDPNLFEVQE